MQYDYAILGAGTAGCVLAGRLSQRGHRVAVLDRGGVAPETFRIPGLGNRHAAGHVLCDFTASQPRLNDRSIALESGSVVGGGSTVNAMLYVRGRAADYDAWQAAGADGWAHSDLLRYFKKSEDQARGASDVHGTGGPLSVAGPRHISAMSRAFVAACRSAGISYTPDFNAHANEGAGYFQLTQRKGRRVDTATAFLEPALGSGRVTLWTDAMATRLLFDATRAVGVEFRTDGQTRRLHVEREILICLGAFGSPQLLLLSGIGPAEQLAAHGIPVVVDLPGVGNNLQDHIGVPLSYEHAVALPDRKSRGSRFRYRHFGRGPLASNGIEAGAFVRVGRNAALPDVELLLHCAQPECVQLEICLMDIRSRGSVRLRSADPLARPSIDPGYLGWDSELQTLEHGIARAREIAHTGPLSRYLGRALDPEPMRGSQLRDHLRAHAGSCRHYVGTCSMGRDRDAVVDPELRVYGIDGLRVADASIMPSLPACHTMAPTIMIGERASDLVLGGSQSTL